MKMMMKTNKCLVYVPHSPDSRGGVPVPGPRCSGTPSPLMDFCITNSRLSDHPSPGWRCYEEDREENDEEDEEEEKGSGICAKFA